LWKKLFAAIIVFILETVLKFHKRFRTVGSEQCGLASVDITNHIHSHMIISIIKILTVVFILGMMILLLISVNHYLGGGFNSSDSDIDKLRNDICVDNDVITEKSMLSELVRVREKPWLDNDENKSD